MRVFVTGANGFIGKTLVRHLAGRDVQVHALVRDADKAGELAGMGAQLFEGDITQPESMREGMGDCDWVFHLAGYYRLGERGARAKGERINVEGTRKVLGLAGELGIPKIVYTSTLAVNGDTRGKIVDESYRLPDGPKTTHYDYTKWQAHLAALEFIGAGLPLVICMPGVIFGPGDHSLTGQLFERFLRGQLPILPGSDSGFTYLYVEDLAAALIAAAERGQPGESYITAGPALTLGELVEEWAKVSGRRAPRTRIPGAWLRPFWPLMELLGRSLPLPAMLSGEAMRALGVTYFGSAAKAKRELGWTPRPLQAGLKESYAAWLSKA